MRKIKDFLFIIALVFVLIKKGYKGIKITNDGVRVSLKNGALCYLSIRLVWIGLQFYYNDKILILNTNFIGCTNFKEWVPLYSIKECLEVLEQADSELYKYTWSYYLKNQYGEGYCIKKVKDFYVQHRPYFKCEFSNIGSFLT